MWSYHEQLISKMLRSGTRYHTVSPATRVFIIPPTVGVAEYCGERVCLSVCPPGYLWNCKSDLHQIFKACYLSPWLGPPLAA